VRPRQNLKPHKQERLKAPIGVGAQYPSAIRRLGLIYELGLTQVSGMFECNPARARKRISHLGKNSIYLSNTTVIVDHKSFNLHAMMAGRYSACRGFRLRDE
jgi:hypothetical protein